MLNIPIQDACATIAEYLGLADDGDIVAAVAKAKHMPLEAFRQFGAKPAKRGKLTVARVPLYDHQGEQHSYFDLTPRGKGWCKKGTGNAGMFFPGRLPRPGETWLLAEGVKDPAALVGLGYLAAGMWNCTLSRKYVRLFTGCHIVLVPDLDRAGVDGAATSGSHLSKTAASVRVAHLPGEIVESGGADVRDVLAKIDGETLVREVINNAVEWQPPQGMNGRSRKSQSTGATRDDSEQGYIANFEEIDGEEEDKEIRVPLSMDDIIENVNATTKKWPRRVDTALFVDDAEHGIGWFTETPQLFGWLKRQATVKWAAGSGFVTQAELFAELRRTSTRYVNVENLPHEPIVAGHYYTCRQYEPGDGSRLRELIARFNPETPLDADLIQAAFMTPGWGGPPGCRPCFVITSDAGRGVGKSTLASMIGLLWGGVLQFSHNEDANKIKTRLLSADALTHRVALLDNVKSLKFSWAELEGMITAPEVGGYRLYVGEATRPNTLTWFITLNGASLSTDMAQRAVIVKILRPKRTGTWEEDTRHFIETHRDTLLSDVIGSLRGERFPLDAFSRWATWEKDILQRLPEPAEAQRVILERQSTVDVEEEEAGILEDYFREQLRELSFQPEDERVFMPSMIVAEWFNTVHNDKKGTIPVGRIINQMITEGRLSRLDHNRCKTWGRGFVWIGENCGVDGATKTDLEERWHRRRHGT
jgi:hypothetical protein